MPPPAVLSRPPTPRAGPTFVAPAATCVLTALLLVSGVVLRLPADILAVSVGAAVAAGWVEGLFRARRRRADTARRYALEVEAVETDIERRLARERHELTAAFAPVNRAVAAGSSPSMGLVVLGRGVVSSDLRLVEGDLTREVDLPGGPLVVRVSSHIDVMGPKALALALARSYCQQLADAEPDADVSMSAVLGAVRVATGAAVGPATPADAEVWFGPDGRVFARSPSQANGQWVALDPQFVAAAPVSHKAGDS